MTHNYEAENAATIVDNLNAAASEWRRRAEKAERERAELSVRVDTLEHELKNANGSFGEFYRRAFVDIYERMCASSDDSKLAADLMEERWNWEACANDLLVERDTLRTLIARAVEALEPFEREAGNYDRQRSDAILIEMPIHLRVIRRLAALAADLRKAGEQDGEH